MEQKRVLKNGYIVVKNPLAYELPKREVVVKSGRTLYRFTGSYDGQRALLSKVLRLVEQDNIQESIVVDSPSIRNVILAPDGIVKYVYPLEGNESVIGLDYFSESEGNKEAIQAKETGELVMGGPFALLQGGQAIVGRLPVTLIQNGQPEFWSIVSITLHYP